MQELHTEIEIEAPVSDVWAALSDFAAYPGWNPFATRIRGELREGARLIVELALGSSRMTIRPVVVHVDEGRAFRWRGSLPVPGLFNGEHAFELEPVGESRTRFVHAERFTGALVVPLLWLIGTRTRAGFVAMNDALKRRCETPPASGRSNV